MFGDKQAKQARLEQMAKVIVQNPGGISQSELARQMNMPARRSSAICPRWSRPAFCWPKTSAGGFRSLGAGGEERGSELAGVYILGQQS